jgi:putative flippase GtrA
MTRVIRDHRTAYVLVGAANAVIFIAVFSLGYLLLGPYVGYMACLVGAYAVAILCAFGLHRKFVFKVRGQVWTDLWRFTLVNLSSLAINSALLPLLVEVAGLPVVPAQVLATFVTIVLNYFGHLRFSFRRTHSSEDERELEPIG